MSSAIVRLFRLGMRDGDAHRESPRAAVLDGSDRYLASSLAIGTIDRLLQRWSAVATLTITDRRLIAPLGLAGSQVDGTL